MYSRPGHVGQASARALRARRRRAPAGAEYPPRTPPGSRRAGAARGALAPAGVRPAETAIGPLEVPKMLDPYTLSDSPLQHTLAAEVPDPAGFRSPSLRDREGSVSPGRIDRGALPGHPRRAGRGESPLLMPTGPPSSSPSTSSLSLPPAPLCATRPGSPRSDGMDLEVLGVEAEPALHRVRAHLGVPPLAAPGRLGQRAEKRHGIGAHRRPRWPARARAAAAHSPGRAPIPPGHSPR